MNREFKPATLGDGYQGVGVGNGGDALCIKSKR